jgi:acyl carrier protein
MSLFDRLQPVIALTLKLEPGSLQPQSSSEDFPAQWDSMGQVNLIMALEEEFGLFIEPEDFGSLKSVPAIEAYLLKAGVQA